MCAVVGFISAFVHSYVELETGIFSL